MANEESVAEQVQAILDGWNAPPQNKGFERLVGGRPDEGDTRATTHTPMEELNAGYGSYEDDADVDDLDSMTKEELQEEAENRGLAKSGSKEDLKARIREYDEGAEDEE